MSDKKSSDETIHEADALELFTHIMDTQGIVISSVSDGILLGVTKDKLLQLLEVAENAEDGRVVIFIKQDMPN